MAVLNDEQRREAEAIVAKYPNKRSALLPLVFLVQSVQGHVTDEGMREVADILGLTPAQVLGSTSFYTMFKRNPQGEYLISVCRNIACTHLGGRKIVSALEERLGVPAGSTTADGKFSLEAAECLATCDGAPVLQINYEDFYDVTPESAIDLVDKLERGEQLRSVRGEPVKTAREISHETATAGVRELATDMESMRTIGGETPRVDTAPGHRPPEKGDRG
ncbi:MAG: NAD(P)H-dependent oxidoreductase subunit E [Actinobacteria bacterium]|nr:NAD(P)H-dependent oxidoreductase subunit E [Actinomycetota bacterium]